MLKASTQFDPFAGPELESVVYTTKSQSEIWTACYFGEKEALRAYNESITMDFNGVLDSIAMDRAIQTLVDRHEALRATFSTDGIYMSIYKQLTIELEQIDLSNLELITRKKALDHYINQEANYVFDLVRGPLIKFGLLKLSENNHSLVITAHHIICDGWSFGIILQDLGAIYSAYVENKTPDLPVSIAFSTYANEEQLFSNSEESKQIEKFWYDLYENNIPIINIPTDNPRPSLRTYKSQRLDFDLDPELLSNLKQIGLSVGASLVSTLLTSFEVFLYKLTGQDDLVVGLPCAGQPIKEMNHLIGHCVNLLPLRSNPNPNTRFNDYLKQRKSELFDAYDHPQLSFGHLLQKLNIARDPSRIPLVPIVFNIDLGMTDDVHFSNLTYKLISNPREYGAFEISLNASGTDKNLVLEWSYNVALFKPETIQKMMLSFEDIIKKVIEDPSKTIGQITFQDFTNVYNKINKTTTIYPNSTLHELFEKRVETAPNSIALEFNDEKISYGELGKSINQTANYLWSIGLRPGQIVAVSLDRSPELITILFAVLQCGASYLPIDLLYPDARLNVMIEDSEAAFFIGLNSKKEFKNKVIQLDIEDIIKAIVDLPIEPIKLKADSSSTAYIIYTSGSTGKPKGVQVAHYNVINFIYSLAKEPGISAKDKIFSLTSISFDPMVKEIYLPLLFGACVVIVDEDTKRDGRLLLKKAVADKITIMCGSPSFCEILLDSGWETSLNIKLLIGGEPLQLSLAHKLLSRCSELWNVYGPTETTVNSLLTQISINDNPISIGKPIANTQIYILDKNRLPVNVGIVGEIAIAGDGVSLGYLNRTELTNERFIANSFIKGSSSKMYLTGDLGKLLPNGHIQCLGRIDHQVKVRGYRIELEELEHVLLSLVGIKTTVVLAKTDILIAYIVADIEITDELEQIRLWRNELATQLPTFMVPNVFNILDKIPITSNGKIDRKALLEYKSSSDNIELYTAPRTETEKLVAEIWKECLNIEKVDIFSNFFELGGHSLVAVKVMNKIEKETGERLPLASLFEYSTVEKLAQLLNDDKKIIKWDSLVPIQPNGSKTPLYIVHGAGLNVLIFNALAKHLDKDQPVFALQAKGLNGIDEPYGTIEEIASYYIDCIMEVNPYGPYAVAGYSFGGVIAYEMAHQFTMRGKKVTMVGLLDTSITPESYYSNPIRKKIEKFKRIFNNSIYVIRKMLTDWEQAKERINTRKKVLINAFLEIKNGKEKEYEKHHQKQFKLDKMNNIAGKKYLVVPRPYKLDLFRVDDKNYYRHDRATLGWKKVALNGVEVHDIDGNHFELFAPPNDRISARIIQEVLDQRNAEF